MGISKKSPIFTKLASKKNGGLVHHLKKNIHALIFPSGLFIIGMDTYGNICWKFPRNSSMETSISAQNSIENRNKYKYQSSLEQLLVALISSKCSDPYISISARQKFLRTASVSPIGSSALFHM